jgi:sugar transferase (PEP-CTERM/EpsH1 system associated)
MKRPIVFISHTLPYPPDKGEKIRAWHVIRHLARDHDVHLGCVTNTMPEPAQLAALRDVTASLGVFPIGRTRQKLRALFRARPGRPLMPDFYHAPALARWVDAAFARTGATRAYIFSVAMAPYALGRPGVRAVLDAMDIDSEKWRDYASDTGLPMRLVWARESRTLLAYERLAASRAAITLFVSRPEADRFAALAPELAGRIATIGNGVDLEYFNPEHHFADPFGGNRAALVLTGHMDYRPNIDAATWFALEVLPRLRQIHPLVEFWIVGANPSAGVVGLGARPGVRVTGRVEDTRPYLAHAAASVCPLRIARGIQNKVLEAMAMGRPVVASPGAYLGIDAERGQALLVADAAGQWVDAVGAILDGQHPDLGKKARLAMAANYAWPHVLRGLAGYV